MLVFVDPDFASVAFREARVPAIFDDADFPLALIKGTRGPPGLLKKLSGLFRPVLAPAGAG
jgi:hypothetical protein